MKKKKAIYGLNLINKLENLEIDMKNKYKWKFFWIFACFSNVIFLWLIQRVKIPLKSYKFISLFFFISLYLSLGTAYRFASYKHRIDKHPISFLGQTSVNGKNNTTSALIFLGFSISYGGLLFLLGHLLIKQFDYNPYLVLLAYLLFFSNLSVFMMTVIPIDLSRISHLIATLCWYISNLTVNIVLINYLIYIKSFGYDVNLIYLVFPVLHFITAIIYLIGYFRHYKASLFQKFWIFASSLSLCSYIIYFSQ